MINNIKIEICIGNVEDAIKASRYPIDRIELNSALELGGLSPALETLQYLKENINTPICCMCRPRGGDFLYNETEFELMLIQAENMLKEKADGIVFGFLNQDKTIDTVKTEKMVSLIKTYNKEAIFHKAFDETKDMDQAIKQLINLKIDRILTSGQAQYPDILEGCKRIKNLNDRYGDKIQLLPGGGVRVDNIIDVVNTCQSGQVHMTSKTNHPGGYICLDEKQLEQMLTKLQQI